MILKLKGTGNSLDFGARIYDSRLGRWMSLDPKAAKQPAWAPYKAFRDNPNIWIDPEGQTEWAVIHIADKKTGKTSEVRLKVGTAFEVEKISVTPHFGDDFVYNYNHYDIEYHVNVTINNSGKTSYAFIGVQRGQYRATTNYGTWFEAMAAVGGEGEKGWGGYQMTSKDGGADPTRNTTKLDVETIENMNELLDFIGAIHPDLDPPSAKDWKGGKPALEAADKSKGITEAVKEMKDNPTPIEQKQEETGSPTDSAGWREITEKTNDTLYYKSKKGEEDSKPVNTTKADVQRINKKK